MQFHFHNKTQGVGTVNNYLRGLTGAGFAGLLLASASSWAQVGTAAISTSSITGGSVGGTASLDVPVAGGTADVALSGNILTLTYTQLQITIDSPVSAPNQDGDVYTLNGSLVLDFGGFTGDNNITSCSYTDNNSAGSDLCGVLFTTGPLASLSGTIDSFVIADVLGASANTLNISWDVTYASVPGAPPPPPPAPSAPEQVPALPLIGLLFTALGLGGIGLGALGRRRRR